MIPRFCQAATWTVISGLLVLLSHPLLQDAGAERPVTTPASIDWRQRLRDDVEFLASEPLQGRSVTDPTIQVAARYIAQRMRVIGLTTQLFDDSPFQSVQVLIGPRADDAAANVAKFIISDGPTIAATLGDGMSPLAIGAAEADVTAPLVFAGYGITASDLDELSSEEAARANDTDAEVETVTSYDDYADLDVTGKAVIILRKEPGMKDPNSPFAGREITRFAYFQTKIQNAVSRGATAVLIVNDPGSIAAEIQTVEQNIAEERQRAQRIAQQLVKMPEEAVNSRKVLQQQLAGIETIIAGYEDEMRTARRGVLGVSSAGNRRADETMTPVVSLARDVVDQLLSESGRPSLAELETQINSTYRPASFPLQNAQMSLRTKIEPVSVDTDNVIGILEGRGPLAEETVIIGAHYDHVGMGGKGSLAPGTIAIHNGADDNASGTATMLAAAERLVRRMSNQPSHRRIVFIAFTGEELGLLGSKHYVKHPRFPIDQTVAMINLDMVGRLRDNELTVYGTGSAEGFDALVEAGNAGPQFDLFKVATGYGPSDHQAFYEAGVPVLFFFTGLHNDYHRPSDDSDKIDFGGMNRITDIVCEVTARLATQPQRPAYAATDRRVRIRRQMTAYLGVRLADHGDHVRLSSITAGAPAERSGLHVGDRLQQLGEETVQTSADVLEYIRSRSPGDEITIGVTRDGQPLQVEVRLDARP